MNKNLRSLNFPLIGLVGFNLLPSLGLRPWIFMALGLILLIYRFWLEIFNRKMPPRYFMLLIQVALPVLIFQKYQSLFGDEAAGTWLTLLTCLKLFELRRKRDYFMTAGLCFLTLMGALLLDQSLLLSAFLLVDVVLILAFLHALEEEVWPREQLKTLIFKPMGLFLKSLPLLVMIFVLFPRFSTGFGSGTQDKSRTGISDRLNPGSVSHLALSDELVFRATFLKGDLPPRETLYWRGAILNMADGLEWHRSDEGDPERPPFADENKTQIEIYLEAGYDKFLFSLEGTRAIFLPSDLYGTRVGLRPGHIFELSSPSQNRERYFLEPGGSLADDNERLFKYTTVAQKPSKDVLSFLKPYRGLKTPEVISKMARYLQNGEFSYTLSPPAVANIDDFLFKSKSGFCEHYAATFATLLRYLGIPSRVVVGFQGGSPSFLENYITVRAFDAHAWIEYYDQELAKWRRFDPTALVAPTRLTLGSVGLTNRQLVPNWVPVGWLTVYLKGRAFVDEVEAAWVGFLLRFDLAKQRELLAQLGMDGVLFRALPVFLILAIALTLAILYFLEAQGREPIREEERLYRALLNRLKKLRIEKGANEGPVTLLARIQKLGGPRASQAEAILLKLVECRYGKTALSREDAKVLRKRINSLTTS